MNKRTALAALLALGMGFSAVAQAQPHGDPRRAPPPGAHHRPGPPPAPHHGPHPHFDGRPGPGPHHAPQAHRRGAGPDHRWVKGYRLPPQYRSKQYVVHNWRSHRLSAPPRGYQWVQYGGDYMLVAIASGVIAQLVLQGMH